MIDLDQTGFLKGRTIAENFVYAAELLQVCHKRAVPTLVLKLDFAKAFDTVNWQALLAILEARGFCEQWRGWVEMMLRTSRTAVLVNGCPGPWITCQRGLRQGDPMSPYLFLLVADVLQAIIKDNAMVHNPLDSSSSCPVLQYADDTLILLRGELGEVTQLKMLLDQFSAATGLRINYHKSTAVSMHMKAEDIPGCIAVLGCRQEGFPQTYLGLPLSCEKLRLSAFDPYISKADRYLAGWQASLLNPMGRTVLINAVLDGQLSYVMSALPLPPGVVCQVDKRRRSFLWTGEEEATGANCLVAWDKVRCSKDQGGLGIKDLEVQNICLLLKLLHKLYTGTQSSWANWVRQHICLASLEGDIEGQHWRTLRELLPLYQAITSVCIGNGRSTTFWQDVWHGDESFAERFPALYSHCKQPKQSVQAVVIDGLRQHLVPRLTTLAADELREVQVILSQTTLTNSEDLRSSPFASADGSLATSGLYKMIKSSRDPSHLPNGGFWSSRAPPRVQFFAWLLLHGRQQCKSNLLTKKIVDDATCELCDGAPETAEHLLFFCPFSAVFWQRLGVQLEPDTAVRDLHHLQKPGSLPPTHFDTFVLLCCWQLWKRCNGIVFRQESMTLPQFLQSCKLEARAWSCRLPKWDLGVSDLRCSAFSSAM